MKKELKTLLASGYTREQLLADTKEIIGRHGKLMLEQGHDTDSLMQWAWGNAWRNAYWKLPGVEVHDIRSMDTAADVLTAEQVRDLVDTIQALQEMK